MKFVSDTDTAQYTNQGPDFRRIYTIFSIYYSAALGFRTWTIATKSNSLFGFHQADWDRQKNRAEDRDNFLFPYAKHRPQAVKNLF